MFEVAGLSFGQVLIILGLICIATEVAVLGFGTIVLLFLGVSLIEFGIITHFFYADLQDVLGSVAAVLMVVLTLLNTVALTYFLWKPLKRFQSSRSFKQETSSDFIGHQFELSEPLPSAHPVYHKLSGIDWQLYKHESAPASLNKGQRVQVLQVSAGKLWVAPV